MPNIGEKTRRISALLDEENPEVMLRMLKEEKISRFTKNKYMYYEPNGAGERFINAVGSGEHVIVLFSAANGVGKTAAAANIVANITQKKKNPYFEDLPLFDKWPYPKKGRIVTDPANTKNVVDTLIEWMPAGNYTAKKASKPYLSEWKSGDFTWDIMTYEQDPKEFEGPTLGWIWFDEPPTKPIYKACVARLRKGGIIFIPATMLKGSGWLHEHIVEGRSDDPEMKDLIAGNRVHIQAGVEEACKQHGIRGHLEHEHIQNMIAEYDEDEKEARVYGRFQHLSGRIFKKFDRSIHLKKPFAINPREWCVYEMIDPHPRNPDAIMWLAVNRQGVKIVVDELYIKCENGTEELAARIKEKASQYRIIRRVGDPSMFIEDQHTQRSLAQNLADLGLVYEAATKMRTASDERIKTALSYEQLPTGEWIKSPEIYFFETCHRSTWEMDHYVWDEWTGRTADNKNPKEKPVDKDDHMIECLGRGLIQEPIFVQMQLPSSRGRQEVKSYDPYQG